MLNGETAFVLFETDLHKSKSSRIFLGIFTSYTRAHDAWGANLITNEVTFDIIDAEIGEFLEQ